MERAGKQRWRIQFQKEKKNRQVLIQQKLKRQKKNKLLYYVTKPICLFVLANFSREEQFALIRDL